MSGENALQTANDANNREERNTGNFRVGGSSFCAGSNTCMSNALLSRTAPRSHTHSPSLSLSPGIEYSDPSAVGSHSFEIAAGSIVTSFCSVTSPSELSLYTESSAAPPILPPASLCADYTIGDTIPVSRWYFDDKTDHDESYQPRSLAEISNFMAAVTRKEQFYYGMTDTWLYAALEKFPIENKRVLLMGSNVPWYEAICLVYKALECVTLEYNELQVSRQE